MLLHSVVSPAIAQPASPEPSVVAQPTQAGVAALAWDEIDSSQFGRAIISEVAYAPTGQAVILGYDPWRKRHARAFRSEDGSTWTARGLPGGNRYPNGVTNVSPVAISATATRLIALGQDKIPRKGRPPELNGVVWRSRAGARWQQVAIIRNAHVADIVASRDGLLIAGERVASDGRRTPTVWTSRGGSAWRRHRVDRAGPPPTAIAVRDGARLVVGHKIRNDLSTWTRLWRSEDGRTWSRIALPGGLSEDAGIRVRGPVATPTGFLLFIGERDRLGETLWRSDDGLDWDRVPMPKDWSLSRSWVIAQPWPWRSLVIEARAFPGSTRQPSLLLTSDGGQSWCRSDGPRVAPLTTSDIVAGLEQDLVMVGGGMGLESSAWSIRWTDGAIGAADGEPFPCTALPISDVMG